MKTIIAAVIAITMTSSVFAAGPDPSPERPADPVKTKEDVLSACLAGNGFTHVKTVEEYEEVRYAKPNHFYFGSKIWISQGSDDAKAKPCLAKVGAK